MSDFKKHPLAVTVASLCMAINLVQADDQIIGGSDTTSIIKFDPQLHDGQKNTIVIGNNSTAGTTVNLQASGNDIRNSLIHAFTVPDPITGVGKTIQTYDELLFNDPEKLSISGSTVDDVEDVNGDQYIDLRIVTF